jgi:hypothetical protein
LTSDPSDTKSIGVTDDKRRGNILVEEDSLDTYESNDTMGKV